MPVRLRETLKFLAAGVALLAVAIGLLSMGGLLRQVLPNLGASPSQLEFFAGQGAGARIRQILAIPFGLIGLASIQSAFSILFTGRAMSYTTTTRVLCPHCRAEIAPPTVEDDERGYVQCHGCRQTLRV